ncbi:MAG TPA: hypothetical protein VGW34_09990 [Allosphingosinicella sp.]|nr:hypothetical protein [Allosphingosinicella sp.]
MSDFVTIANLTLSKIGEEDQLRDPDQDSHAARTIRAAWSPVRRAVLRGGKFNCSMTRAELSAQSPTSPGYSTPYPFRHRFPVPSDFLRLVEVIDPPGARAAYKFERGAVLADTAGPLFILYAADLVETALWDDLLVEAFSNLLGWTVCDRITGDRGRKADCWSAFRAAIAKAAGVDAKEDPPIETEDSSWITARYG